MHMPPMRHDSVVSPAAVNVLLGVVYTPHESVHAQGPRVRQFVDSQASKSHAGHLIEPCQRRQNGELDMTAQQAPSTIVTRC